MNELPRPKQPGLRPQSLQLEPSPLKLREKMRLKRNTPKPKVARTFAVPSRDGKDFVWCKGCKRDWSYANWGSHCTKNYPGPTRRRVTQVMLNTRARSALVITEKTRRTDCIEVFFTVMQTIT